MGCGASTFDGGNGLAFPAKLRPIFAHRLEEIKMRRHHNHPLKIDSINSTPSRKELLLPDDIDNDAISTSSKSVPPSSPDKSVPHKLDEGNKVNNHKADENLKSRNSENKAIVQEKVVKVKRDGVKIEEHRVTDSDNSDDDVDNDDDVDGDERMIGHRDGGFPGSPSFRVYFKDDGRDKHIIKDDDHMAQKDVCRDKIPSNDTVSSKECCSTSTDEKKKITRGKKKSNFRKVLPKGGQAAVKNLFSASSCYTQPPSVAHNHHANLLTGKTTA